MAFGKTLTTAVIAAFLPAAAFAGICDYKPSRIGTLAAAAIGGAAVAGTGTAMTSAGFYTLVHAGSGLTMLGSTAAGASAAGTVGIIAGTGGVIGTVGAILMAPVTIVAGAVVGAGAATYEGACYFQVVRITDPLEVRKILDSIAKEDESVSIIRTREGEALQVVSADGPNVYLIENLYIADGRLKHRDRFVNSDLGPVLFGIRETEDQGR